MSTQEQLDKAALIQQKLLLSRARIAQKLSAIAPPELDVPPPPPPQTAPSKTAQKIAAMIDGANDDDDDNAAPAKQHPRRGRGGGRRPKIPPPSPQQQQQQQRDAPVTSPIPQQQQQQPVVTKPKQAPPGQKKAVVADLPECFWCRGCDRHLGEVDYSEEQLKLGGKRCCAECIAKKQRAAQAAAATESVSSSDATAKKIEPSSSAAPKVDSAPSPSAAASSQPELAVAPAAASSSSPSPPPASRQQQKQVSCSLVRCRGCRTDVPRGDFSAKQLALPERARRCTKCISGPVTCCECRQLLERTQFSTQEIQHSAPGTRVCLSCTSERMRAAAERQELARQRAAAEMTARLERWAAWDAEEEQLRIKRRAELEAQRAEREAQKAERREIAEREQRAAAERREAEQRRIARRRLEAAEQWRLEDAERRRRAAAATTSRTARPHHGDADVIRMTDGVLVSRFFDPVSGIYGSTYDVEVPGFDQSFFHGPTDSMHAERRRLDAERRAEQKRQKALEKAEAERQAAVRRATRKFLCSGCKRDLTVDDYSFDELIKYASRRCNNCRGLPSCPAPPAASTQRGWSWNGDDDQEEEDEEEEQRRLLLRICRDVGKVHRVMKQKSLRLGRVWTTVEKLNYAKEQRRNKK